MAHALVHGSLSFRYVRAFATAGNAAILTTAPVRPILEFASLGWTPMAIAAGVGAALQMASEPTKWLCRLNGGILIPTGLLRLITGRRKARIARSVLR